MENQSIEKMPDLYTLPANVQLQIYDLFLALRTYQRQCRLDTICAMIKDGIDQARQSEDDESDDDESDFYNLNIPDVDGINIEDLDELRDSLPSVICNGFDVISDCLLQIVYEGDARLNRCSMSLDDDEEDIQVLRLCISTQSKIWDAIYDIHTFEYLTYIKNSDMDFQNDDLVEVMKHTLQYICQEEDPVDAFVEWEDENEPYCQWMNEVSEENYTTKTYSDEFTKMRSLLHERFSSCS